MKWAEVTGSIDHRLCARAGKIQRPQTPPKGSELIPIADQSRNGPCPDDESSSLPRSLSTDDETESPGVITSNFWDLPGYPSTGDDANFNHCHDLCDTFQTWKADRTPYSSPHGRPTAYSDVHSPLLLHPLLMRLAR